MRLVVLCVLVVAGALAQPEFESDEAYEAFLRQRIAELRSDIAELRFVVHGFVDSDTVAPAPDVNPPPVPVPDVSSYQVEAKVVGESYNHERHLATGSGAVGAMNLQVRRRIAMASRPPAPVRPRDSVCSHIWSVFAPAPRSTRTPCCSLGRGHNCLTPRAPSTPPPGSSWAKTTPSLATWSRMARIWSVCLCACAAACPRAVDDGVCVCVCLQNDAMPFTAGANINAGSIVSLSSNGTIVPGFGMQLSNAITTVGIVSTNPIILNMTGKVVVVLYNDSNMYGWASYYDTTQSIASVSAVCACVPVCLCVCLPVCLCVCV